MSRQEQHNQQHVQDLQQAEAQLAAEKSRCDELEAQLQQRERILDALTQLSQEIPATLGPQPVLETVARLATQLLDATGAYIFDIDNETGTTTIVAEYVGPEASDLEKDVGARADWLDADKPYFIIHADDPDLPEPERQYMEQHGIQSVLSVPMLANDKAIALLEIYESRTHREFTSEEAEMIRAFVSQAAMALNVSQLHEQWRCESKEGQSEERAHLFLEALPEPIVLYDGEGNAQYVNSAFTRVFGWTAEEVLNKRIDFVPEENLPETLTAIERLQHSEEELYAFEAKRYNKAGNILNVEISMAPVNDEQGRPAAMAILRDVTKSKQAQQHFLRQIIDLNPSFIFAKDREGRLTLINKAMAESYGSTVEELTGKLDTEMHDDPEEVERSRQDDLEVIDSRKEKFIPVEKHTDGAGNVRWMQTIKRPIVNEKGEANELLGVAMDVTERVQAEEALATRLQYERALSAASQSLLSVAEGALTEALEELRKAADVSRVYVFANFEDPELGLCAQQTHEACAPGVESQIDNPDLQALPYELAGFGRWAEVLGRGDYINAVVADLPENERSFLEEQAIQSILVLPITIGGEWYGLIGFDDTETATEWGREDINLLWTGASMIGAYIERHKLEEEAQESLKRRSKQAEISSQLAREIASDLELGALLEQLVTLIKEDFGYYHVQLLRYDPALENLALQVGYGEVGAEMAALNHSVPMDVGAIGRAAAKGEAVLLGDVRQDDNWQPNHLLPNTKSELAVPIRSGDEILGVLDVHSSRLEGLTANDQLMLEGICAQIAIAIESARLRQEMESRLRELDTLQRYMSRRGWERYTKARYTRHSGYRFDQTGVQPIAPDSTADNEVEADYSNGREPSGNGNSVATPTENAFNSNLVIRGEAIGKIGVQTDPERPLTAEEEEFLNAVTQQVAEALEAARLFQQTQASLAEQERLSSELTTVAELSTAASTILETDALLQAVTDLAKDSFNLYHAHIYLYNEEKQQLELAAGAGDIGRLMTLEGRDIALHADSLVARAARTRQGFFENDVQKVVDFLPHPLLPDTRSEMAIPMVVGNSLVGIMDLQSDEVGRFSEQDMDIFKTLASQVAVATQNARLYAEQVETAEELRKVDQLKSEFLASMSHELRTPLNSIIGFADVLLEGIDGELNERMEEDVRLIRDSGSHLRALIGDILDMSKLEAGMMEIRREKLDMCQMGQDIIATANPQAEEKGIYLKLDIDDDVGITWADRTRVRQILWNIVGNAIKFTDEGGVTLAMEMRDEEELLISVSDTGIGIRDEDLPIVFEQFRQVGGELNTKASGGTGLGLPISKRLVELHGGDIWIESEAGEGTIFFFTLPAGPPEKPKNDQTGPLPKLK